VAWVLFLPNAPYLLTEFPHLNPHHAPHNMRAMPLAGLPHSPRRGPMHLHLPSGLPLIKKHGQT
jgi:hypothetical protein